MRRQLPKSCEKIVLAISQGTREPDDNCGMAKLILDNSPPASPFRAIP
jgi:hypothetical protein